MNVILAEDHTIVRNALRMLLETDKNIKVSAEARNGQQVLDLLESDDQADVVLSDIDMPLMDGISLAKALKNSGSSTKVIILSMHEEETFVLEAFRAGVCGYLLKSVSAEELVFAINHIYSGGRYLCSDLVMAMLKRDLDNPCQLRSAGLTEIDFSPRELEVLQLIAEGLTNQQMSDKLFLSKRTIEGHRQSLIDKTGVRNTAGLISFAMRNGLIQ